MADFFSFFFIGLSIVSCPDCRIELNPSVHKFCYVCGEKVEGIISSSEQYKGRHHFFICFPASLRYSIFSR